MLARMSSAGFVHTYGWPTVLEASMNSRIADSSERTLSCTPRRSCFVSRAANQRSTRLSHEAYVGVEVRMKARVPGEPSADQRGLVRPVVVHDDVHVQVGRHLDIEGGQEGAKLDRAMPPTNLTQHVSRLHFQCGKERRRPVPFVVVGPPFSLARAQGEQRRRAIQGLDLRLFVDAEDRGVLRRIEIQPHDVADLVDEQRIRRQLEALRAMRLQSESLSDAMHTHRTDARGLRQRARAPVGRAARCRFQRLSYDGFHLRIVDRPRGTRPRSSSSPSPPLSINRCRQRPTRRL